MFRGIQVFSKGSSLYINSGRMKQITAYKEDWEYWVDVWHKSRENADELFQTEVTDQDFDKMMTTDYYEEKVEKLLEHRPFDREQQGIKSRVNNILDNK